MSAAPDQVRALALQPGHVEPGVYDDVPEEDYHRSPGASKHQLDVLRQESPAHLKCLLDHPRPATPAQRLGRAFHALVLEPATFDDKFIALPGDAPKRPTAAQRNAKKPSPASEAAMAWWDAFEAEAHGKEVLSQTPGDDPFWSPSEWDQIHYMRDSIDAHPIASLFLAEGRAEQSVYAVDPDLRLLLRCRTDFWNTDHQVIVDLKMARDASLDGFSRATAEYRYHVQDAFYLDVNYYAGRPARAFVFVACEPKPPYAVGVYAIKPKHRDIARRMYLHELEIYKRCLETGEWPAYETQVRELELPPWAEVSRIR